MSRHACPTCHTLHSVPKARSVLAAYMRLIVFTTIEVLAALALEGWLSLGIWAIAAWNVVVGILLTVGLANTAASVLKNEGSKA